METFIEAIFFEGGEEEIKIMVDALHHLLEKTRGEAREKLMRFLEEFTVGNAKLNIFALYDFLNNNEDILAYLPANIWKKMEEKITSPEASLGVVAEEEEREFFAAGERIRVKLAYENEEERKKIEEGIKRIIKYLSENDEEKNLLLGKFIRFLKSKDYVSLKDLEDFARENKMNGIA